MVWPRGTRGGVEKRSGTGCTKPRTPQIPLSVVRSRKVKLHSHFIMRNIPVGRIIKIKLWRTYLLSLGPDSRLLLLEVNLMASGVSRPPVDLDEFPDVSKLDLRVVTFSDLFFHTLSSACQNQIASWAPFVDNCENLGLHFLFTATSLETIISSFTQIEKYFWKKFVQINWILGK